MKNSRNNMFQNAIEKINKFYEIDLSQNVHFDKVFDVLSEIITFNRAAIFYLAPNLLTLEYGRGFEDFVKIQINDVLSCKIYDNQVELAEDVKNILNLKSDVLIQRLVVKKAVFGIVLIERNENFTQEEYIVFNTCAAIISNLLKDLELSKVLKMQVEALQAGIIETNKAYETIKKQNKKIKENEKLQNEFIANISHDLRTPLNSIIGFSELLSNKIFGELTPKQTEYVNDIRLSGLRLLGMINEVLDISKIESRTIKLNYSEIDFNMLVSEVCNILKPLIDKKQISILKNIENHIFFTGDYVKIQQVVFNLVGNALKFSSQNSEVEIFAKIKDNKLIFHVKDNGIGIEKKYHKKIFDKFFQIKNPMSKTEISTGLGLTITKEFVKLHGGRIKLESEPGKGTTFIVSIPTSGLWIEQEL